MFWSAATRGLSARAASNCLRQLSFAELTFERATVQASTTSNDRYDDRERVLKLVCLKMMGRHFSTSSHDIGEPTAARKPKQPLNAFERFIVDYGKKNPGQNPADTVKVASAKWRSMNAAAKAPYEKAHKEEQDLYKAQMNKYKRQVAGQSAADATEMADRTSMGARPKSRGNRKRDYTWDS
mmetsp:Transcript_8820/g.19631  ORF Transcript_8820/g.19631 Transcript_8820/m.19631 type:complete len:182 (+) Transcript_8820:147-692(+)